MIDELTEAQKDAAYARARDRVNAGHHFRCASKREKSCDCYFGAGDYLVARLLLAQFAHRLAGGR